MTTTEATEGASSGAAAAQAAEAAGNVFVVLGKSFEFPQDSLIVVVELTRSKES
jgi:hypothetical protein